MQDGQTPVVSWYQRGVVQAAVKIDFTERGTDLLKGTHISYYLETASNPDVTLYMIGSVMVNQDGDEYP